MPEQACLRENEAAERPGGVEKRAWVRFACKLDGACQPLALPTASVPESRWSGAIHDLSAGGISIQLDRRFEPGAHLTVDIPVPGHDMVSAQVVEVVRVAGRAGQGWVIGCKWLKPLTEQDVATLLGRPKP